MIWEGSVFVDKVLPFGLCSAPLLFEWGFQYSVTWSGISMTTSNNVTPIVTVILTSDASGQWGGGRGGWSLLGSNYNRIGRLPYHSERTNPHRNGSPIWGDQWRDKTVLVRCDNSAVVSIVNLGTSKNQEAMHLRR